MTPKPNLDAIEDAITADIQAIHGGFKAVSRDLWPTMKPGSAYARLKNCLRDDMDAKLAPGELLLIKQWARAADSRATLDYELGACHCAMSRPVEPETEKARLQREFVNVAAEMKTLMARIDAVSDDEPADELANRRSAS